MSCYWFNREKLLKNAWDKYHNNGGKEKTAKYYAANQEGLIQDARNKYINLLKKTKDKKGNIKEKDTTLTLKAIPKELLWLKKKKKKKNK